MKPTTTSVHSPISPHSDHGDTLSPSRSHDTLGPRRKSFDDGFRPTNGLLAPESLSRAPGRTSRADKRSSINPGMRLDWTAAGSAPDSQSLLSPPNVSPVENAFKETTRQPNLSRDSGGSSPSPSSRRQRDSPTPSSTDEFYSPLTSPATLSYSQHVSQSDFLLQRKDSLLGRKHSLQDTTWPPVHPHPSLARDLSDSEQSISIHPHTSHDDGGALSQQQVSLLPEHPKAGFPVKDEPSLLPYSDDTVAIDGNVEPDVPEGPRAQERSSSSLGFPRISFHGGNTDFQDLLKLGRQPDELSELPKIVDEASTSTPKFSIPKPSPPIASTLTLRPPSPDTQYREEDKEAGPSDTSTLTITVLPVAASSVVKPQPSPLRNVPLRNDSLTRKMSARKPVPKAIVLPETFEGDMALDMDDTLNVGSGGTPARLDVLGKALDSVGKLSRRPGSPGVGFSAPPPLSPRSQTRRSSGTVSPLNIEPHTPPMRSTSNPIVTVTDSGVGRTQRSAGGKTDATELVAKRIKEALTDAQENGATNVRLDREFLEVIFKVVQSSRDKLHDMNGRFDGMRVSRIFN